jgi:hypothetical protein
MLVTVVVKSDAQPDTFVGIIKAPLSSITDEQRKNLRRAYNCDEYDETDEDQISCLFFRELELKEFDPTDPYAGIETLVNIDGIDGWVRELPILR